MTQMHSRHVSLAIRRVLVPCEAFSALPNVVDVAEDIRNLRDLRVLALHCLQEFLHS